MPMRDSRGLALTLAGVLALLLLTALRYQPPAPLPEHAPAALFSAGRATAVLRHLLGDGRPHPMGSAANAEVRARILERLTALGYTAETHSGVVCHDRSGVCGSPVNILARLPNAPGNDDGAILLAAHYDSVAAGPGAADDGAGVAAVLEIARALKEDPALHRPVIFLITDGEEAGLLGATLFVEQHPWARQVTAAVNLEARGTAGPSFMFETGSANQGLLQRYAAAVAQPMTNSLYYVVYKLLPNDTDFTVFKAAGYQGYNFAFIGDVAHYHTRRDTLAQLDPRSLQHQGENALHALRALAADPAPLAPGEAVYFDLFRWGLVQWPTAAALPLALLALAALLANCVALHRRQCITGADLLSGAATSLAALLAAPLAAVGLFLTLRATGTLPAAHGTPWIAHPGPALASFVALAFATSGSLQLLLGRRTGFWGATLGHALVVAVLGVLLARALPGASFVLLVPAAAALLAVLPVATGSTGPATAAPFLGALPALATFAVLLPLVYFLYDALGVLALPILTGTLVLGAHALAPLLTLAGRPAHRGAVLAATLAVVAGLVTTVLLPTYSAQVPQRLNLEYRRDADLGRAFWLATADARQLPAELAAAAAFVTTPGALPPPHRTTYRAAAPDLSLPAPELRLLAATASGDRVSYRVRLVSPRAAPEVELRFAAQSGVRALDLVSDAMTVPLRLRTEPDGGHSVTIKTLPAAGGELRFETPARAPVAVQLLDRSYDFPRAGRFLQDARDTTATPSREGDVSVVQRTVHLSPP